MSEYDEKGFEDDYISIYFLEGENLESFNRELLTFLEILEKLGGFLEIIVILSAFLVGPFNSFFY